ncbi:hypothetical protein AAFF_G00431380, partial [Aldrovandia affinis]
MLHVLLSWQGELFPVQALIDSGSDANLICPTLVRRMGVPVSRLATPLQTKTLMGTPLAKIQEITQPLDLLVSGNHRERLAFYLMESPLAPVVLGGPWLATHNLSIDWTTGNIQEWSAFCQKSCLHSATTPGDPRSMAKERPVDLSLMPPEYHDLGQAFKTNGQTERYNQELGKGLRCLAEQTPTTWSRSLPWVEYAHNS